MHALPKRLFAAAALSTIPGLLVTGCSSAAKQSDSVSWASALAAESQGGSAKEQICRRLLGSPTDVADMAAIGALTYLSEDGDPGDAKGSAAELTCAYAKPGEPTSSQVIITFEMNRGNNAGSSGFADSEVSGQFRANLHYPDTDNPMLPSGEPDWLKAAAGRLKQ